MSYVCQNNRNWNHHSIKCLTGITFGKNDDFLMMSFYGKLSYLSHIFAIYKTWNFISYQCAISSRMIEWSMNGRAWAKKVKLRNCKSSRPEMFLRKGVLKICSKFTGEYPCRSAISIKLLFEIALWHGYCPVNLLHIFRTSFPNNTSGRQLL